jgi:hypothetical protein
MLGARVGEPKSRAYRRSAQRVAHDFERAEELVAEGLAVAGLLEEELERLPGADARKLAVARVVRSRTTASLAWIAERLKMKSAANVGQQLRTKRGGRAGNKLVPELLAWMQVGERMENEEEK